MRLACAADPDTGVDVAGALVGSDKVAIGVVVGIGALVGDGMITRMGVIVGMRMGMRVGVDGAPKNCEHAVLSASIAMRPSHGNNR